jgi:serine/threonine protein kinase
LSGSGKSPAGAREPVRDEIARSAVGARSPEPDPHAALARARLGKIVRRTWRLDTLLGVGGMAAVYAATHRSGRRAALKMLHPALATAEAKRRFQREGYLANSVGHPGVVTVLGDGEAEDGAVFLVMEKLDGESLESYAARRIQLAPPIVLAIGERVLDVLDAAHEKGIVHRDVKPENVFLCTDGRVMLLDFGIARLREMSRTGVAGTHHGSLLGTPSYMAPEQARGDWDVVDGRTDVWSTGATLFRVLTGRTVHRGGTPVEVLIQASQEHAPKVRDIAPQTPAPIAELIDRSLAFEMSDRWSSASDMLDALRAVHRRMGFERVASLHVKIAADTVVASDRPPPLDSEEFDRAAALEPAPDPDVARPSALRSGATVDRAKLRSLLFGGGDTADSAEDDVVASGGPLSGAASGSRAIDPLARDARAQRDRRRSTPVPIVAAPAEDTKTPTLRSDPPAKQIAASKRSAPELEAARIPTPQDAAPIGRAPERAEAPLEPPRVLSAIARPAGSLPLPSSIDLDGTSHRGRDAGSASGADRGRGSRARVLALGSLVLVLLVIAIAVAMSSGLVAASP